MILFTDKHINTNTGKSQVKHIQKYNRCQNTIHTDCYVLFYQICTFVCSNLRLFISLKTYMMLYEVQK